jgi:uncharacterized protein
VFSHLPLFPFEGIFMVFAKWMRRLLESPIRLLLVLLVTGFCLLISVNLYFYITEDERLRGTPKPREYKYQVNVPYTEYNLPGIDSGNIHAVLFQKPSSKGVIFYFPGVRSDVEHAWHFIGHFMDFGYDLMIVEYRGCGKSTGPSSEEAFYSDAWLLYGELRKKYREDQIVLCGHSFGAAIAANITSRSNPAGLLLVAPLYSINERYRLQRPWHYRKYKFETYKYVEETKCPIYLLCGTSDPLIKQSRKLLDHTKPQDSLITISNEGHVSIFSSPVFNQAVSSILQNNLIAQKPFN